MENKTGVELIADESHDDDNDKSQIAYAAACYAIPDETRRHVLCMDSGFVFTLRERLWQWKAIYWKPTPKDRIKELSKAGALIAAEIDRLQRLNKKEEIK